jgi:hypothetical protein
MTAQAPSLDQSVAEVENPQGSNAVVVARFEPGTGAAALITVAAGARQRLEKFSRLTLSAPEGGVNLILRNPSPLAFDLYRETAKERALVGTLGVNEAQTLDIGAQEQIFVLPRLDVHIPPPPRIVDARYNRGNPLTSTDNFISLHWIYPPPEMPHIAGFRLWRAIYRRNIPLALQPLTPQPIQSMAANIGDFGVSGDENHRYAVTAVGLNGVESLFSNVLILDSSSLWGLTDAGSIPL